MIDKCVEVIDKRVIMIDKWGKLIDKQRNVIDIRDEAHTPSKSGTARTGTINSETCAISVKRC